MCQPARWWETSPVLHHHGHAAVTAALLAHQGGWDEILLVVGPLILVALVLRTAKRRADRHLAEAERAPDGPTSGVAGHERPE